MQLLLSALQQLRRHLLGYGTSNGAGADAQNEVPMISDKTHPMIPHHTCFCFASTQVVLLSVLYPIADPQSIVPSESVHRKLHTCMSQTAMDSCRLHQ